MKGEGPTRNAPAATSLSQAARFHIAQRGGPLTIFAALFILEVNFETHAFYAHTLDLRILKAQAIEKLLSRLRTVFRWRLT